MLTAFLITTLVMFALSIILNLLVIGINLSDGGIPPIAIANLIIYLFLISWNIYILATL